MSEVNPSFIKNVANSIRNVIQLPDFYKSNSEYFNVHGKFNPEIDNQILNNLLGSDYIDQQIIDNYLLICDRQNSSELYQLHINIFSLMSSSSSASSCNIGDEDEDIIDDYNDENTNNYFNTNNSSKPKNQQLLPSITLDKLGENQENVITSISTKFRIHPEIVEALYQLFQFDSDILNREIASNLTNCMKRIGLNDHPLNMPIHFEQRKKDNNNESCLICFDDEENDLVLYSLPCKHYFCAECIADHIKACISNGKSEITCPCNDCQCRIVRYDIIKFGNYQLALKNFNKTIEKEIEMKPEFYHCIREGCPNILTSSSIGLCDVATCSCGCRFCWKCKELSHAPLECNLLPKWREIAKEENAELKWIKENTKACPKCHERIQRDGGCTYIKCPKCNYEFCYVCGGPFPAHQNHNASCTVYRDYDNVALPSNVDMDRLSFYLTRFLSNKVSHENEVKQREERQNVLVNIFHEDYDVPYERLDINDSIKLSEEIFNAIDEARSVLMWSYPHAFFLSQGSSELKLFENAQQNLSCALENLVNAVENKEYYESPRNYRQMTNLLKSYTRSLLLHVTNKK